MRGACGSHLSARARWLLAQGTFVDTAFLMMAHDIKQKMTSVPGAGGSRDTGFKGGEEKKGCC